MRLKYGSETDIMELDEHGSTVTIESKVHKSEYKPARYKRFKVRVPVKDKKEELAEYLKFADMIYSNENLYAEFNERYEGHMFDPSFTIEHRRDAAAKGHYYIVKSWVEKI